MDTPGFASTEDFHASSLPPIRSAADAAHRGSRRMRHLFSHPFLYLKMNTPECIITGCVLYVYNEEKFAHGDLHRVDNCLIFNAVLHEHETFWTRMIPMPDTHRMVTVNSSHYFERRGVIVFSIKHSGFNEVARKYMAGEDEPSQ